MGKFEKIAEQVIVHKIRYSWFEITRLYNELALKFGITLSQGFTLLTIREEGTPVTKIAPRMGMEPNSLSRLLKKMEKEKLISRIRDKKDKRKVYVKLTKKGKQFQNIAYQAVFRVNNDLLKQVDKKKIKAFYDVIEQVPRSLSKTIAELKSNFS